MKKMMIGIVIGLARLCLAEVTITDVMARQRYPWNGLVDIVVTFDGAQAEVSQYDCAFAATNTDNQTALTINCITRRGVDVGADLTWQRKFVWDAKKDLGAVKISEVRLCVSLNPLGGVQLWESGPCWAECNVGATQPEEYGYYFWWGDTIGYKMKEGIWNSQDARYENVIWQSSSGETMSGSPFNSITCPTYNKDSTWLKNNGYVDNDGNLTPAHDAATQRSGKPWRMPTDAEHQMIFSNCETIWTTQKGVYGLLVRGRGAYSSKSIFLPASGFCEDAYLYGSAMYGHYYSSMLYTSHSGTPVDAWGLFFGSSGIMRHYSVRCYGRSVRPVRQPDAFVAKSTSFTLDCQEGARTIANTEMICYSGDWVDDVPDGALVVVMADENVLTNATGSGTVSWKPKFDGRYMLTHNVMTNGVLIGEVLTAVFQAEGVSPKMPVINPASGTIFDTLLTVSMSCETEGVTIHYTIDGTTPTMESSTYKKFKVYDKTTVKAIAFYDDGTPSEMAVAEYAKGVCAEPYVLPADGTAFDHSGQVVTLGHDNPEGVLRYTTDGSDPTEESAEYVGPLTIDETTTVKAKVFGETYFDSRVVTANLTRVWLKVATPEISAPAQFTGSKQKVTIASATDGALVRYTTNGNDPNSHSTKYTGPFYVTDTATVKAYATKSDYANSDVATLAIMKDWGIGDTMGKPDHAFATSGDAVFVRTNDASAALGESMRSGPIGDGQRSVLSSAVIGPGTLSFKWKTSCEQDDEYEWDHAEFRVNGVLEGRLNGVTDWVAVSQRIEGEGTNTVTWTYIKDDVEYVGEDCLWVSEYVWASDYTATQTTDVPVPYDWLREKSRDIVDEYGNYEKVAKQKAYNQRYTVEQCYVAGLDPESATNEFTASIEMVGSVPNITWSPDKKSERDYKIWGKKALDDGAAWECPTNALHRFFKVTVEMP